ncbi:putative aspartate kinase [Helianthus annuus]|nr:putative aspartate kinase [Helianthus annuus]
MFEFLCTKGLHHRRHRASGRRYEFRQQAFGEEERGSEAEESAGEESEGGEGSEQSETAYECVLRVHVCSTNQHCLKRNVTMLDIVSTRMLGQCGFLAKVFSIFEDLGISVDVVATSEVSISLTLDPSKLWSRELIQQASELDHVVEELEKIAKVNLLQHRSIISLIGNVQRSSLVLEKAFDVLRENGVNV